MLSFLLLILVTILAAVLRWRWWHLPHRAVVANVFLCSIALNYVWEVGQIPLFEGFASASFLTVAWHCAWYTLGDACIVIALYALGAWGHRSWGWGLWPQWRDGLWLPLAGILVALGMERFALAVGRWSYNSDMPLLPVVEVGFLPVVQMALLPLLSVVLASRFVLRPEPFKR